MSQPNSSQAPAELTGSTRLAHLAGAAAAGSLLLAFALLVLVAPGYLESYADQSIAVSTPARIVMNSRGALGWGALLVVLGIVYFLWLRATKRAGHSTLALFMIAGLVAVSAILVTISCARPLN